MKTLICEFKQNDTVIFSAILNSKFINRKSKVLLYGSDAYGYQREIKKDHVKQIKMYIENNNNPVFPTSIILAIDKEQYQSIIKEKESQIAETNAFFVDLENVNFRIVDGQHRLKALEESNVDIPLNVLVMVISKENRKLELEVFTNLNSKAKRIPTDLAELAKYKYQLLLEGDSLSIEDSTDYVSMKTVIQLNADSKIWKKAIKVDIHSDIKQGIVGVSAYKKSIRDIIKKRITTLKSFKIDQLDQIAEESYTLLNDAWMICHKKWKYCFHDLNSETIYSKDYYIQKTMGISVINGLLKELSEHNQEYDTLLKSFETIITNSKVQIEDWKVGGIMYGHSSEAGFRKIRKLIKGEINSL